ncbi:succinylglutamate desuccinylase [Haloferax mediterranei ATCC 33500]|uniref:Serine protease n=1 Tax=Haloferax mediterranei (strain ATCC 33500 / DSM 1411 / JCM 8866 / NBRC 14739 / NCIMB 2177 / R-4) TaxID=523841 RepID=I3R6V3_HALMT|nr:succinylglutamate desuccinylase/aspartoacylase family protein [Haloferax mediterranei]AFK19963.2 serine protease [Haloferax mediterranei ATCC 33500]AHZ23340.1 succinylglutamate desuccinylase [Haloferax mediterranei ATCC 33500]ELZ99508.1 serine protease [Haloferax mediterranei ATCC 33500]MDX5987286.1 succinylglutamate desuccinylase/aspartoacylase family protein [Haloferax mediterranei ATCC 33500]QCQ73807.1 succinylglutamate desuccinylase [Haloferax mediterranei ATCC 33500]
MHTAETVTLARLPSGVPVQTTVHTYEPDDGTDGPTLYVQAAQHGREINGTEVLRRLHSQLERADLSGRVVAVPVADPLTFDRVSYATPEALDSLNSNMNRVWPGDAEGTLHERMAATLWEFAGEADAIVDLHTGSPDMLTHTVYRQNDDESRELAEAFGADLLLAEAAGEDAEEEWTKRNFDGKLRVAATTANIPSITPELAHNKQLVESAIVAGVEGLLNVCRSLSILTGAVEPWNGQTYRNHLGRVSAATSGLFVAREDVELGHEVRPGDHLGWVYDPTEYTVLQEVEAERAGIVYSITREATVTAGTTLVGVALPLADGLDADLDEDDPFADDDDVLDI